MPIELKLTKQTFWKRTVELEIEKKDSDLNGLHDNLKQVHNELNEFLTNVIGHRSKDNDKEDDEEEDITDDELEAEDANSYLQKLESLKKKPTRTKRSYFSQNETKTLFSFNQPPMKKLLK